MDYHEQMGFDLGISNPNIDHSSTFIGNMKLPIHRWFRYSAGFSAEWIKYVLASMENPSKIIMFDPFAGSGTTLIATQECGIQAIGLEAHPFVVRIARAKAKWNTDVKKLLSWAEAIVAKSKEYKDLDISNYPDLIYKCFPEEILRELTSLSNAWLHYADGSNESELCWLGITSILRSTSPVGTSQMELIQPKKSKSNFIAPTIAFMAQIQVFCNDIKIFQHKNIRSDLIIHNGDARLCSQIPDSTVNLIITSPPYINNFDYADATRLEMSFWREIKGWGDLQEKVRRFLVRSCSQHMSSGVQDINEIVSSPLMKSISEDLAHGYNKLAEERLLHGGKKNYHLMVAAYFYDLAQVWRSLRRITTSGTKICFVVGDSAPYGIYIPVHIWLGKLAIDNGFDNFHIEKIRDRNIKWKNRKHRVPLSEVRLWVNG